MMNDQDTFYIISLKLYEIDTRYTGCVGYSSGFYQIKKTLLKINIESWKLMDMLIKVWRTRCKKNYWPWFNSFLLAGIFFFFWIRAGTLFQNSGGGKKFFKKRAWGLNFDLKVCKMTDFNQFKTINLKNVMGTSPGAPKWVKCPQGGAKSRKYAPAFNF